jgi:ribosomal protein S18 acetylase RimI-like enzyme
MKIQIRSLKRSDIVQVVSCWCTCLPYDKITVAKFEDTIFEDPNYEREGNLVATKNDEIVGFVAAVVREGIAGLDGAGRAHEEDFGYIKGLFTLKEYDETEEVKRKLLEKALDFMKSKNKRTARVVRYTGRYFFPGIDTRYEEELRFYRENGFEEIDTEEDVMIDLIAFQPTEYQRQAQRRTQELKVVIKPYQSKFLEAMRRFAKRLDYPQWFPEGWESDFAKKGDTLVALSGSIRSRGMGYIPILKQHKRLVFRANSCPRRTQEERHRNLPALGVNATHEESRSTQCHCWVGQRAILYKE